jgi:hypothetical protein
MKAVCASRVTVISSIVFTTALLWGMQARILSAVIKGFGLALLVAVLATAPAKAAVTYSGIAPGNDLPGETNSATVVFALSISGTTTNLVVTLSNTATYKPNDSPDILTAVYFQLAGDPTLTRISGVLNTGGTGVESGTNLTIAGGVIGGSWVYAAGLSLTNGANQGISSAGFGIFGATVFPGAAMPGDSPVPDGVGGGITTSVDDGSLYNGGLKGRPLIKDSAVFTLGGVPASFTLAGISDVSFNYGTIPDQTFVATLVVPEPSSVALVGLGFVGLLAISRRKK